MRVSDFGRFALSTCVVAALLAGCGGSQPPIGAPGGTAEGIAAGIRVNRDRSWRSSNSTDGDLIYAVTASGILILTYPAGKRVGQITQDRGLYVCSDPISGNVFVTSDTRVYEYPHGGTKPIATLSAPSSSYIFGGCSVNGTTGDLAIANVYNKPSSVVVYPHGSGKPNTYTDPNVNYFTFCGYDGSGNLFIDGVAKDDNFLLAELSKGSSSLTDVTLNEQISNVTGPVQWDGAHVTVERPHRPIIYQISVSGSIGTIVGNTTLRNQTKTKNQPYALTWIQDRTILAAEGLKNKRLAYWDYPAGGKPTQILNNLLKGKNNGFGDVTVSVGAKPLVRPQSKE